MGKVSTSQPEDARVDETRPPSGPTFYKHVCDAARSYGDAQFVYDGIFRMSFSQLELAANMLGSRLQRMGVGYQDVVVCCIPNWVEFIQTYAAVSACGAIFAPASADVKRRRLAEIIELTQPKAVFVINDEHLAAIEETGYDGIIIGARIEDSRCIPYSSLVDISRTTGAAPAQAVAHEFEGFAPVEEVELSTILFTSGTTGAPKGVIGTAHGHTVVSRQIALSIAPTREDVFYVPIAYCHIFGINNGLLIPLMYGSRLVLTDWYSPTRAVDLINEEGCTIQLGVPTMFLRQLAICEKSGKPFGLREGIIGGATIPPGFIEEVEARTSCRLLSSYGMTESTGGVTYTFYDDPVEDRYGADGRCIEGARIRIVDETGAMLPAGEVGEIGIKTPGMMAGYYSGGPIEPAYEFFDDWFETGDLGRLDEKGLLHITGRKRDVIMRGGDTIYPSEVECIFQMLPGVRDVCLVGYPDPDLGEKTCLFIATGSSHDDDFDMSVDDLMRLARTHLEKHKVPDKIVLLDKMPRLQSGKIDKRALREDV